MRLRVVWGFLEVMEIFFPQHPIEQGRLAGVGCAEYRDVTGFKIGILLFKIACLSFTFGSASRRLE